MFAEMQFCHHVSLRPSVINAALVIPSQARNLGVCLRPQTLVVEAET